MALSEGGIPLGTYWGTRGPGKWEFLMENLLDRSQRHTRHVFVLGDSLTGNCSVPIRVTAASQRDYALPKVPADIVRGDQHAWEEVWKFEGYVPQHAIGVRGFYSPISRIGIYHLWLAHVDDYGCAGARRDLVTFFGSKNGEDVGLALVRAMQHTADGIGFPGEPKVRCTLCWNLFNELRQSCELP